MGQHGQRLNTGTCFSVSSDDKLVLFLFPGIPTGMVHVYTINWLKKVQNINYCSHAAQPTFNCHKRGGRGRIMAQLFILSYLNVEFNSLKQLDFISVKANKLNS
jgi:hypothetical protein